MESAEGPKGYWPSPWPGEDGGPARGQTTPGSAPFEAGRTTLVTSDSPGTTMVVLREPGEVFVLRHTFGPDAVSWVERIDPGTLKVVTRSDDLPAGPMWPGGLAAHANGSLYVVFGRYAHRLDADLNVLASTALPRDRPYNSFVILPDGHLATKDFGGILPGVDPTAHQYEPTELVILEPDQLAIVDRLTLPEPSIARLSADGDTVFVVGTTTLFRATWSGSMLLLDEEFAPTYISMDGQSYGWDPVIALGAAWFLDNGRGSDRFAGTFRGQGINPAPLHLVRVDLATGAVTLTEICGLPNGVVANPPLIDERRRIAVGYDSGNGVLAAFDIAADGTTTQRWRRDQDHGCHMVLLADPGQLVTDDHDADRMADDLVVLDIETGDEQIRLATGSPLQSVVFPAVGWDDDIYYCSFTTLARLSHGTPS